MKWFALALLLVLAAGPALAQETLSIDLTAAQSATLTRIRMEYNNAVCKASGLADGCTLAQLCTATTDPGTGQPFPPTCTLAQLKAVNPAIDPVATNTAMGKRLMGAQVQAWKAKHDQDDRAKFETWWSNATQAERDATCATIPAGSRPGFCK